MLTKKQWDSVFDLIVYAYSNKTSTPDECIEAMRELMTIKIKE